MTECAQPSFTFANHGRRQVVARFDGGTITSDGGGGADADYGAQGVDIAGEGLDGERIGLEEIGDGLWRVWFLFYELGRLDEREGRLLPRPEPAGEGGSSGEGPDSGRPRAPSARPLPGRKVLPMSLD